MDTQHELTRAQLELEQVRAALNDPKIGLFTMRKLYARYGQLLRQIDDLKAKDIPEHERQ